MWQPVPNAQLDSVTVASHHSPVPSRFWGQLSEAGLTLPSGHMNKVRSEEQVARQGWPRAQPGTSQLTSLSLFSFSSVFDFL